MVLKWLLNKYLVRIYIGLNLAEDRRMVGFFGYGNEHLPPPALLPDCPYMEDFSSS